MTEAQAPVPPIDEWLRVSPYCRWHGFVCENFDITAGRLVIRMPLRNELRRSIDGDWIHGGAVAALIDTAGDLCVAMATRSLVPTINFRVDYLRPSTGAFLLARAAARRISRSIAVVDVDVVDSEGRTTAIGRGCFGVESA